MNDLKNQLFYKFALVVFIIIALFEGALIFGLKKAFYTHLQDRLQLIANEINPDNISQHQIYILQRKYHIFPLFIRIEKNPINNLSNRSLSNKLGFFTYEIGKDNNKEKILQFGIKKKDSIIYVSTFYSTNEDKIKVITNISLFLSFIIYLIVLWFGHKFISTISQEIELSFKKLKNFNSNVSHELKTPLAIMKSKIDVFLMNHKDKECKEVLKDILNEIEYINNITDKLLFLTRDRKEIKKEEIDLEELIFEVIEKYENKIGINLDFGEDDYIIKGDKTLLKIAFNNLIENSIKYKASLIKISLTKNKNKILLSIKDNGIGIPPEKIPFIFDEFYRVDESHNKKIKGFGLGLSIVKNILQLHKSKIRVIPHEVGVEFVIEFPKE